MAFAEQWVGYVADEKCARGGKYMGGEHNGCVASGQKVVLVNDADKKLYTISNASKVTGHLGRKVEVTGKMIGNEIEVETVTDRQSQ
jgi:hypothetical protein